MEVTAGRLMYYYKDPFRKVPIFISGDAPRCVLWMGGQSESFFTINYFGELAKDLGGDWSFAQMELPSSHIAYGAQDHLRDAEDVDDILELLSAKQNMQEIVLFATSTGVQVALALLANGRNAHMITRVILHGIVSPIDNEFFNDAATARCRERVMELLAAGRKEDSEAMVGYYDLPITAARLSGGGFPSLQEALWQPALSGDNGTVSKALGHIAVPTLIMIAAEAQYKPSQEMVDTVVIAAKTALGCSSDDSVVQVFNDTCDELRRLLKADIPQHVKAITAFLQANDEKRAVTEASQAEQQIEDERLKRIALNKLLCE